MNSNKFDPTRYKGRKTITVGIPNVKGVRTVWDWSERKGRYEKRMQGLKFYAHRKINGKERTKQVKTLSEALIWRETLSSSSVLVDSLRFQELKAKFFVQKKTSIRSSSFETLVSKTRHFSFFDSFVVADINPRLIDEWLAEVKTQKYLSLQHSSRTSYRSELDVLKQIFSFYIEYICEHQVFSNPVRKRHYDDCVVDREKFNLAKAKGRSKFLGRDEVERFLSQMLFFAEEKKRYELFYVMALFQARTGARIGEVCALTWADIDLLNGSAFIHRSVCWSRRRGVPTYISPLTKSGDTRTIFFPKQVVAALTKWKLASPSLEGLVFGRDAMAPYSYRSVQHAYDRALTAIDSCWRGTHILRHSFATDYIEKTGQEKALQAQLGHRDSRQTNHYAKITNHVTKSGMDFYDSSFGDVIEGNFAKARKG